MRIKILISTTLLAISIYVAFRWSSDTAPLTPNTVTIEVLDEKPFTIEPRNDTVDITQEHRIFRLDIDRRCEGYIIIKTPAGLPPVTLKLPDGTYMTMNSLSRAEFPSCFSKFRRDVTIKGEVYVKVSKNANSPFIVHSGGLDVTVLGTAFNVNAYSEDPVISLVEGSLSVSAGSKPYLMTPGKTATLDHNTGEIKISDLRKQTLLWTQGEYYLQSESMESMVKIIYRIYGIEAVIEGDQMRNRHFNGRLRRKSMDSSISYIIGPVGDIIFEKDKSGVLHFKTSRK